MHSIKCFVNIGFANIELCVASVDVLSESIIEIFYYYKTHINDYLKNRIAIGLNDNSSVDILIKLIASVEQDRDILITDVVLSFKDQKWKYFNVSSEVFHNTLKIVPLHVIDNAVLSSFGEYQSDVSSVCGVVVNYLKTKQLLTYTPYNIKTDHLVVNSSFSVLLNLISENINNTFNDANMTVDCILNDAVCVANVVAKIEKATLFNLIIDIGANATSFSIVKNSVILFSSTIQLGGIDISRDIASVLNLPLHEAEKVKLLFSESIFSSNFNYKFDFQQVQEIVFARIKEIFLIIKGQIPESFVVQNIILTGGVAKTPAIDYHCGNVFNVDCVLFDEEIAGNVYSEFVKNEDAKQLSASMFGCILHYVKNAKHWEHMKYGTFFRKKSWLMRILYGLV
jgi:cell division ATPase FtsA